MRGSPLLTCDQRTICKNCIATILRDSHHHSTLHFYLELKTMILCYNGLNTPRHSLLNWTRLVEVDLQTVWVCQLHMAPTTLSFHLLPFSNLCQWCQTRQVRIDLSAGEADQKVQPAAVHYPNPPLALPPQIRSGPSHLRLSRSYPRSEVGYEGKQILDCETQKMGLQCRSPG